MADNDGLRATELSDEQLEEVAGGVLDEQEQARVLEALTLAKQAGQTLEQAMASYMRGNSRRGSREDYVEYMTAIWGRIGA